MDNMEKLNDYLQKIDDVIENGHYKDNWENFMNHKVPEWYRNAKFGIFMHWGVYAVNGMGGGYSRKMYMHPDSPDARFMNEPKILEMGENENFGYKDFVDMFKAEKFDAGAWADLFKEAGARFVMPVAEHHDGFQMYDSDLSEWCASKKGPKKDTLGMLKKAVEERGMNFCASSHRIEHYWFMGGAKTEGTDMPKASELKYGDMYWPSVPLPGKALNDTFVEVDDLFMKDWLARTCEIVDKYQPDIVYFDWWIQVKPLKPYLKKFMAYYYNRALEWGRDVTINYKNDAFVHTSAVKDIERGQLTDISPYFWQNDTSVSRNTWTYTEENDYKSAAELIEVLIDVVSKNGSLLLNIGPKADGTISDEETAILKEIGQWLKVNGEAIYDTYPWRKYGIGPTITEEGHFTDNSRRDYTSDDFRFTFKNGALYVFAMKWPEDGVVRIPILGKSSKQYNAFIDKLEILGFEGAEYTLCDYHLTVMCDNIVTDKAVCIKITTN